MHAVLPKPRYQRQGIFEIMDMYLLSLLDTSLGVALSFTKLGASYSAMISSGGMIDPLGR